MEDTHITQHAGGSPEIDIKALVRDAIREYTAHEQTKVEPAYKAELIEERKRREHLESRVNELIQENKRTRAAADEAERSSAIRSELQRLGVTKVDLAFRAVKDDIIRTAEGKFAARDGNGESSLREYLSSFVAENPELLPARISGSSGVTGPAKSAATSSVDLDKIRPGMSPEELEQVRREIVRVAQQSGL